MKPREAPSSESSTSALTCVNSWGGKKQILGALLSWQDGLLDQGSTDTLYLHLLLAGFSASLATQTDCHPISVY